VLKVVEPFSFATVGQGNAVMRDAKRSVNFAGSDPRCDGAAIPQSPVSF
jgi:gamma-glutamyltranspeptidase/glutathione hydrolase